MSRCLRPDDDGCAVDILYSAYRDRPDCPDAETFIKHAARFELAYMMHGEKIMGVAMRRAGTIHIGVMPAWRRKWATRTYIRELLEWAGQTGKVNTTVAAGNEAGLRLVLGVGFTKKNGGRYELQAQP